jgi:hypothetical protein
VRCGNIANRLNRGTEARNVYSGNASKYSNEMVLVDDNTTPHMSGWKVGITLLNLKHVYIKKHLASSLLTAIPSIL